MDVDAEAAVIAVADVLPRGLGVVAFERWLQKLVGIGLCDSEPELMGGRHVSAFVNGHGENQIAALDAGVVQKAEKEPDQAWIAVHEDNDVRLAMGLGLRSLAPVGDGARDEELPVGKLADLGTGSGSHPRALCLAYLAL